jgi:hypothetical protein
MANVNDSIYTIGITSLSILNSDAFNKTNEKLNAPRPRLKVPEIIIRRRRRRTNGLLLLIIVPMFENMVTDLERPLFMAISFTNNIKIRTAIAPRIRDTKNI